MESRTKKKRRRKLRWKRIILLTFFALFITGGLFVYNIYGSVVNAVDKMSTTFDRGKSDKREDEVEFNKKDPISILLVGVDERKEDSGRTDSMLILTVNPELKSTKIVSIPRDTRAELIDKSDHDNDTISKMNHAYAYGGIGMTIDSIENFLNIPIDYYVKVNMEGFRDIVDAVGGIDVDNKYAFELDGTYLSKGDHHLDGEEALQYARMRKQDPNGDFGRQERQREVITKVIKKGASVSGLTNYDEILGALSDNVETSLKMQEIVSMQKSYLKAANSIEKIEIPGENETIDGTWFYLVDDDTRQAISDELRTHLGLKTTEIVSSSANDGTDFASSSESDNNMDS
ncbi:LCP family glycopolymer transferase [Bacillus benzoevorans]|uniref:LCP family protein required for cell wall assembly n=1 Tax=Bacillus benzoevorans TaxID=1456 RepID=A0A7X0HUR9_9BACI|nr:LCP family protein [Bacillus benzoevorans]MBB6447255.1 LCP family protein required for cell wall assembly [Bacillus benzoevorans]